MGKIVVFDSGLGSLSIINAIRNTIKSDIIYFADQKNYPYGVKSESDLEKIIFNSITSLREKFRPDLIVVGSNTPSILFLRKLQRDPTLVLVLPPITEAQNETKTDSIGILATRATIMSKSLNAYVSKQTKKNTHITKIDATNLIDLVESGKFISNKKHCLKEIRETLHEIISSNKIDVITLSSTHLPLLLPLLKDVFPTIKFLDPAQLVADNISKMRLITPSKRNSLKIFCSGDPFELEKNLRVLGIRNAVKFLQL